MREAISGAGSAGKHNAHGVASFHLSGLLDQSRQLVMAYAKSKRKLEDDTSTAKSAVPSAIADVSPRLKMRTEICQRKRREIPKGGVEDWYLSDEERFVRWPGAYLDAGSSVGVRQANPIERQWVCARHLALFFTPHVCSSSAQWCRAQRELEQAGRVAIGYASNH